MPLLKPKQLDVDALAVALMTRIEADATLKNQFWNLSNSVNTFVTTPSTAGPVKDIVIDTITGTTAQISWSTVLGATGYEIQYTIKGDTFSTETIVEVTSSPFTLIGLTAGTTYEVQIKPVF